MSFTSLSPPFWKYQFMFVNNHIASSYEERVKCETSLLCLTQGGHYTENKGEVRWENSDKKVWEKSGGIQRRSKLKLTIADLVKLNY